MASRNVYLAFVLPAAFSVALGAAVLGSVLQEPGRSLESLGMSGAAPLESDRIAILGLGPSYGVSETIVVQVVAMDDAFDCGDLYVTITRAGADEPVFQDGYFGQCYAQSGAPLPVEEGRYAKALDTPGTYEVTATLVNPRATETAEVRGVFTVG